MTTATLRVSPAAPGVVPARPRSTPKGAPANAPKGWWRRLYDRFVDARMQAAEIELRRQMALLPRHLADQIEITDVTRRNRQG